MSDTIDIIIKSAEKKYNISVPSSTLILDFKKHIETKSSIPSNRQRLIYSGRVLKDKETLAFYKVQSGHTIHLVKGAAKPAPGNANTLANSSNQSTSSTPNSSTNNPSSNNNIPSSTNMATGTGAFNPLADITGARFAGYGPQFSPQNILHQMNSMGLSNASGEMPSDEQMERTMNNPMFQEGMRSMLRDPQMIDYLIEQSPQLRAMGPMVRQMLQSEQFREMMTNPQMMRNAMEMQRSMQPGGAGPGPVNPFSFNSPTAPSPTSAFPAPGVPSSQTNSGDSTIANAGSNTTTNDSNNNSSTTTGSNTANSAANPTFPPLFSPWAMFPPLNSNNPANPTPNPASNQFMDQFLSMMQQQGANPATAPPVDTRPPEERYESQLRQLNDMGFFEFDRNIAALRRSGGSVQGAVEYLLNGDV
ncbi:ubiquitin domain-containing protein DSK2 ASCRUDRAFT_76644 [Ascoidea rubescens DSM 1968]|uniref:Ubiquitin-domain-containing protein n=1 Tax=Ascoidea rubescens DSM 1968 TaxID=1344418 RepID=A0A1D2VET9_9ASCO|nr:hypothetical protein ASCRUDRAFT_76644 [Ascoidea rubescens DSM 1968]ODV60135.1 hypothetical protein ASCRUDRAFT_76644 [Ascoidea rubescens DSM 1968]